MERVLHHESFLNNDVDYLENFKFLKKIRVCLIGNGRMGNFHKNTINNSKYFELVCIIDPLKEYCYKNLSIALLDHTFDALIICSPSDTHSKYVWEGLKLNKHIFVEKPLGYTKVDICKCFLEAEKKERVLFIGFNKRYDKQIMLLKNKIKNYGPLHIIKITSREHIIPSIDYLKESGGFVFDMLIHDIDISNYLKNDVPTEVYGLSDCFNNDIREIGDIDTAVVIMKYSDGTLTQIDCARETSYGYDQRIEVFCKNGAIISDNKRDSNLKVMNKHGTMSDRIQYSFLERYKESYELELKNFYKQIVMKGERVYKLDEHIHMLEICSKLTNQFKIKKNI